MIKLGIALPAYGSHLDVGHAAMWLGLGAALLDARDKVTLTMFTEYHINGIDLCRNTILYDAMQAGCDWVFMIDADTFHRSTGEGGVADAIGDAGVDIIQMIRDADRGEIAVQVAEGVVLRSIKMPPGRFTDPVVALVGAPVRGRGDEQGVCVHKLRSAERGDEPGYDHWADGSMALEDIVGKIQPVARIGGACIAVNCGWFRRFWKKGPWFEMVHNYEERPKNARGEDYSICDGIYKRGGVVLCDGRFVPSHVDRRRLVGEGEENSSMVVKKI
jgi:hypothetical protein